MIEPIANDYEVLQATRRAELLAELEPPLRGQREITLEIGAGHGHFLAAYAAAHPDRFCVGIDIMSDRVRRGLRKRDRAGLANLTFLHADAGDFLAVLPLGVLLAEVFVLFPDPWPKRRHWKNRLIQPSFLETLARRAPTGAPLYFRTDYEPYFEEALATIDSHADWELSPESPWPFEHVTVFQARAPSHQSLVALRREPGDREPV